jgi:hypothetical protein
MTPGGIGLLVLKRLLIRRVSIESGFGAELLGQGDLLRPWQGEGAQSTLSSTSGWRVLEDARIAVLDRHASRPPCALSGADLPACRQGARTVTKSGCRNRDGQT